LGYTLRMNTVFAIVNTCFLYHIELLQVLPCFHKSKENHMLVPGENHSSSVRYLIYTTLKSVNCKVTEHLGIYCCVNINYDRLCGLVVRVLGYRSGGPGSIPVTTRKRK
jgi:hypothetical protein